jgi:WXG100 family type VII secretion target
MAQEEPDAVLAKEANNFERISGELKSVIAQVEGTAGALIGQWQGAGGDDSRTALERFREAAARQVLVLNDISGMIHASGVQYASTSGDSTLDAGEDYGLPLTQEQRPDNGEFR